MKPLSLTMTAFGSYAEETTLSFEKLKSRLYLITGDTGAGKSTIFDAIMFALFGVASGADRKREMLHCDYVPKSVKTVVTLRFEQDGKEYTVERTIRFGMKGKAAGKAFYDATLTEPDRAPTVDIEKVTARCEELLGLNAEQFGRIIMLAQGEFKKFLKADSDEKNAILGKLFDNSDYVYYQNLLLGARAELEKRRAAITEARRSLMEDAFQRPESFHEMEQEAFLPEHPALLENLEQLVQEETEALEASEKRRDEALKGLNELSKRQGEAETVNALLRELAEARKHLAELEALDGDMARRQTQLSRSETALHKAMPAIRRAREAEEELNATLDEIEDWKEDLVALDAAVAEAEAAVKADAPLKEEKSRWENNIHTIEKQLPDYDKLARKQEERQKAEQAKLNAVKKRGEEEAHREKLDAELASLREKLEELEGVDGELARCEQKKEKADKRLAALAGKTGLRAAVADILAQEAALEAEKAALLSLTKEAGAAAESAEKLYQSFIAAQAAVLADDLRLRLEERGEAQCPVCGSHLHREQRDRLAALSDKTPDMKAVDRARRDAKAAEDRRSEKETSVQRALAGVEAGKQAAADRAAELLPGCDSWETLRARGWLDAAIDAARQEAEGCQAALFAAEGRKRERDKAKAKVLQKEEEKRQTETRIETYRSEAQARQETIIAAEGVISTLLAQLQYQDKRRAEEEKTRLEQRVGVITRQIEAHQSALKDKTSKRDTVVGSLKEKQETALDQTAKKNSALYERDRVLEETGFESPEAVSLLLAPQGQDGEAWLVAERSALNAHENDKKNTRERIETREKQTAGKQPVDLGALEEEARQLSERHSEANAACSALESLLKNHRYVSDRAKRLTEELSGSERAWKRLDNLATLAGGSSGEGGKLSFDRYVMGAMFREVLEMANRRMDLMSGGRYELKHRIETFRANAKAGLEIEVLDNNTGLRRPSGSLSGGETFFTSLSLALGLSDVVQNHAGGKRMDALFIDEGFGTLSDDVLDKALEVLRQLTEGNRLVGIISHVDKLDESIPQKIRVRHSEKGSSLALECS